MRTITRILLLGAVGFFMLSRSLNADDGNALNLAWFEIRPGIVVPGQPVQITAWIENGSSMVMDGVSVRLTLPDGVVPTAETITSRRISLRAKEAKRLTWHVVARRTGIFTFQVEASGQGASAKRQQSLSVVARRDPKREYQTVTAAWLAYPERPTLQEGNASPLGEFKSLPSASLKHNLFGISAHLPRSTNDEDPFIAPNAVDGSPDTCWASRWWRTAIPLEPEWIEVDLGSAKPAVEVRFLPAWRNGGAPAAFTIQTSIDGKQWNTLVDETDYHLQQAPNGAKLRYGDRSWQCFPFGERPVRYVRLEATRLTQGPTSFFCCSGDPFQLRVAELAVFDKDKKALTKPGCAVKVSTTHTAWYNTPESIKKTWPLLLRSGVKLNRIGFWGDKTDWAIVEKTKGVYTIDPEVDRAIAESCKAGIDTLLCLCFGNNLYQQVKDPQNSDGSNWGATWNRGHPFLQCAPTTPEAVEGFANYCAFMAKHFRGRIKYFEIWNEENGWFFDAWSARNSVGMVRAYGKALAAAAKAVKEANPDAVVLFGGVAFASLDFPRIAMEEGAGPYVDIYAFHPYGRSTSEAAPNDFLTEVNGTIQWKPRPAKITNYEEEIEAYKEVFRRYNPNIKVWADEMNWFAPGQPPSSAFMFADQSELSQAKYLARFLGQNAWLDTGAIWWSLYNANYIMEWAVVRSSDCSPRAAYYSAGYVATVLDDCKGTSDPKVEVIGKADGDLVVKVYRNGKGQWLVGVWRKSPPADNCKPTPVTLLLPEIAGAEIVDTLYGYRQQATVKQVEGGTQIPGLLVGDWPLILRIEKAR